MPLGRTLPLTRHYYPGFSGYESVDYNDSDNDGNNTETIVVGDYQGYTLNDNNKEFGLFARLYPFVKWNKNLYNKRNKNLFIESVPEQMEVVEYGSGLSIPEWYCKHYHDQKEIKRSWQNTQGNLINWKREISKWFENDGKPTRESEHGKMNRGNSRKSNANTGTLNE